MDTKLNRPQSPISLPRESIALNVSSGDMITDAKCCGNLTNTRLLSFSVKVSISVMILSFSMFKLWKSPKCDCNEDSAIYISLIASIMSAWLGAGVSSHT